MGNRLFDEQALSLLHDPSRWRLVSTLFPSELAPVDDRPHRHWRLRHTHAHPHREVMLALAGDALYGHPVGTIRCAPGACLYFDAREAHDDGYPTHVRGAHHLWISFAGGWVFARQLQPAGARLGQRPAPVTLGVAEIGLDVGLALDRCRSEAGARPALARLDLLSVIQSVVARVVDAGWRADTSSDPSHRAAAMAAVRQHISDTAGAGVSLDVLCELSGYSRFHLVRLFQAESGMSLRAWIDRCRLERIQHLQRQRTSLADAADDIGFSSASALSRWCRRHGVRWKNQARADAR